MKFSAEAKAIYGINLSYNEIKHLKNDPEWIELAEKIRDNSITLLWNEMGYDYTCPSYNCDDTEIIYLIGYHINSEFDIINFNKELIINNIKKICNKLHIKYKEPELHILPHIC